jgi:ABC-type glutathione transport system ATPase component
MSREPPQREIEETIADVTGEDLSDEADITDFEADVTSTEVTLSGLTKQFGDTVAVDGIDLNINPAELLVLLGPSGGKRRRYA